tara:strand:+ start:256 stop:399 length:144 start_codon:yes stop_codon:yes gene_type:complete
MNKLPKEPFFYFFSIPISFLAGYGYATSLWLVNQRAIYLKQNPETCI